MRASPLAVERIEFLNIRVKANPNWKPDEKQTFPQLQVDLEGASFEWRSHLDYSDDEAAAPQHFAFRFSLRLIQNAQKPGFELPYDAEIEARVFISSEFPENISPKDRFGIVRESGYPILYGAIREMLCNLTARSTHGLWHIPSMMFREHIKSEVEGDEEKRLSLLATFGTKVKKRNFIKKSLTKK
jgi:hypothetical protein